MMHGYRFNIFLVFFIIFLFFSVSAFLLLYEKEDTQEKEEENNLQENFVHIGNLFLLAFDRFKFFLCLTRLLKFSKEREN